LPALQRIVLAGNLVNVEANCIKSMLKLIEAQRPECKLELE
jgi:hypothetical protein